MEARDGGGRLFSLPLNGGGRSAWKRSSADGAVSRAKLEAGGARGRGRSVQKQSSVKATSRRLGQHGEGSGSGRSRSKGKQLSSTLPTMRSM
ncbi:Os11g0278200 [Oryza sativa Japonica Group]|uniref:Os11g0278200 protein n=1 Tax=Oryza sativa subsp. japonica TaxID=39947 RepID=A0A0P0Y175_ORYSJ|nr:Os11g0278200 [Oryza sativa Japonica Group]